MDTFLGKTLCLFFPHLSNLAVRNEVTELFFGICSRYCWNYCHFIFCHSCFRPEVSLSIIVKCNVNCGAKWQGSEIEDHVHLSFYSWKKQTQASRFVTIFLRQWKKWLTVFCETSTNYSRQTTGNSSMKVIYKSRLLRSLQWWYNKATLYVLPSIFAVIPLLRRNSDAINQSNLRNFSAYIIIIGNSMICSNIWHKYHKWYFKIVIHNFMSL